ncbi:MAG: DsbA family protein [Gemmobacter sp.]
MRPFRPLLAAAALALALPAAALDLGSMTAEERAAFRAEVRAYLLDNPEVLLEAIGVIEQREARAQADADIAALRDNRAALEENPASWAGGNLAGDITVVEFVDYRCGYCRRAHEDVQALVESDGNIRIVVKEFPILGPDSVTSSRFAIAVLQIAGPDAYKVAHDALIALAGPPTPAALRRIAADAGVDGDAVLARMDAPEVTAVIAANRALGERLQINGTPSFVIHETMVRGFVPLEGMRAIVAGQRAKKG